ncbi:MAG: hypothetical protein LAN71_11085 [Acidobacteriia bacterium]|nr:hypothetical protein [Terriglobia bacterium]
MRRSRRRSLQDHFLGLWGVLPWRCTECKLRFHARAVTLREMFYAHCPICGNRDLEAAAPWRFHGPWAGVARGLRLRGVRCDLCRENFFTILPVRRGGGARTPAVK